MFVQKVVLKAKFFYELACGGRDVASHGGCVTMESESGRKNIPSYAFQGPWSTFLSQVLQAFESTFVGYEYTSFGERGGMAATRTRGG